MSLYDTILRRLRKRMAQLGQDPSELTPEHHSVLTAVAGELADMAEQDNAAQDRDDEAFLDHAAVDFNASVAGMANLQFTVRAATEIAAGTTTWLNAPAPAGPSRRIETQFQVGRSTLVVPLDLESTKVDGRLHLRFTAQRGGPLPLEGMDRLPLLVHHADVRRQLAAVDALLHPTTRFTAFALDDKGAILREATLLVEALGLEPQDMLLKAHLRCWTGAALVRQFFSNPGTLAYIALTGTGPLVDGKVAAIETHIEGPAVSALLKQGTELLLNCVPAVNGLHTTTEMEIDHSRTTVPIPAEPGYCPTGVESIEWLGPDRRWRPVMPLLGQQYLAEPIANRICYGLERTLATNGWNLELILHDRERGGPLSSRFKIHVANRQICPELPANLIGATLQCSADARATIIGEPSAPQFPTAPGQALKRYLGLENPLQPSSPTRAATALRTWLAALAGEMVPVAAAHRAVHARLRPWRVRLAASPVRLTVHSQVNCLTAQLSLEDTPTVSDGECEPVGLFAAVIARFLSWQTDGRPIQVTATTSSGAIWEFPKLYQGEVCR